MQYGNAYYINSYDTSLEVYLSQADVNSIIDDIVVTWQGVDTNPAGYNPPYICYASDSSSYREVTGIKVDGANLVLQTYSAFVEPNEYPRLLLTNETTFTPDETVQQYLGIKKTGANTYIMYYLSGLLNTDEECLINKVTINTLTDTASEVVLETLSFPTSPGAYRYAGFEFHYAEKMVYFTSIKAYTDTSYPYGFDIYIYDFDVDTETLSGGLTWQSGGTSAHKKSYWNNIPAIPKFVETDGAVSWVSAYWDNNNGSGIIDGYLVVDGAETLIISLSGYTMAGVGSPSAVPQDSHLYNQTEYLINVTFGFANTYVTQDGIIETISGAYTTLDNVKTQTDFDTPRIGYTVSGTVTSYYTEYFKVNPETGEAASAITLTGVKDIRNIFPIVDSVSGLLYAHVVTNENKEQVVGFDYDTLAISQRISGSFGQPTRGFAGVYNMGNLFFRWSSAYQDVQYIFVDRTYNGNNIFIMEQN